MIRLLPLAIFFSLVLAFSVPAGVALALECSPGCGVGQQCVPEDKTNKPVCIDTVKADGTVAEVVVTAAPRMTLKNFVNGPITSIGNMIIALLFAAAFFLFIFGVFRYFFVKGGDPKARIEGRGFIIWSIIALAVLFSVWGLVRLVITILPT